MSTVLKTLSIGCLCALLAASCNNGTQNDCADQVQKLQQQITEKDQRISALQDSLRMAMGNNSGATQMTDTTNNTATATSGSPTSTNQAEENMYRKGSPSSTGRKHGGVPGEFPEGSTRILTEKDVKFLSEWGLRVMQNEIYARHGMMFTGSLQKHFSRENWYHGSSNDVSSSLTSIERHNIAFLKSYKYNPELPG